jgi:hypothetical protein
VGLFRRLQRIGVPARALPRVTPRVVRDVVPLDPRKVSLLLRKEQGGSIVHSSVHALSAVLGEELHRYDSCVAGPGLLLTSAMRRW